MNYTITDLGMGYFYIHYTDHGRYEMHMGDEASAHKAAQRTVEADFEASDRIMNWMNKMGTTE